jgi:hypothetical protein
MSYIAVTLNHFRAVQAWAGTHGMDAQLDVNTFELEVKARNRYFRLFPQFLSRINGRLSHTPTLSQEGSGFIGWLPYRPLRWNLSNDKLSFKRFLVEKGQRTPAWWNEASRAASDYVMKQSAGSFGYELIGPFKRGEMPAISAAHSDLQIGSSYIEQFVAGRNLKAWCWGAHAFYAHVHSYPVIEGDGQSTALALIKRRLRSVGVVKDLQSHDDGDMVTLRSALAYQGVEMDTLLQSGQQIWLDYRYGRRYANDPLTAQADNGMSSLTVPILAQIDSAAALIAQELRQQFAAPLLYSLDGVIDSEGVVWWLEVNSNPILPPEGYAQIFGTLFDQAQVV